MGDGKSISLGLAKTGAGLAKSLADEAAKAMDAMVDGAADLAGGVADKAVSVVDDLADTGAGILPEVDNTAILNDTDMAAHLRSHLMKGIGAVEATLVDLTGSKSEMLKLTATKMKPKGKAHLLLVGDEAFGIVDLLDKVTGERHVLIWDSYLREQYTTLQKVGRQRIKMQNGGILNLDWFGAGEVGGKRVGGTTIKASYTEPANAPPPSKMLVPEGELYVETHEGRAYVASGEKIPLPDDGLSVVVVSDGEKTWKISAKDGKSMGVAILEVVEGGGANGKNTVKPTGDHPFVIKDGDLYNGTSDVLNNMMVEEILWKGGDPGDAFVPGKPNTDLIADGTHAQNSLMTFEPQLDSAVKPKVPVKAVGLGSVLGGAALDVAVLAVGYGLLKVYERYVKKDDANFLETLGAFSIPGAAVLGTQFGVGMKGALAHGMTKGSAALHTAKSMGGNLVKGGAVGLPIGATVFGITSLAGVHPENEWGLLGTGVASAMLTEATLAAQTAAGTAVAAGGVGASILAGIKVGACALGGFAFGRAFDHTGAPLKILDPTSDGTWSDAFAKDPWLVAPMVSGLMFAPVTMLPGMAPFTMAPGAAVYGGHKLYQWHTDHEQYEKDMKNLEGAPERAATFFEDNPEFFSVKGTVAKEIDWMKTGWALTKPDES